MAPLDKAAQYLANAYAIAGQSRDQSNQNGSVLINAAGENTPIATGVNNFPPGVKFTEARSESRPEKYRYFGHAERNAIYQAARSGKAVYGSTMYCPWAACCPCARALICSGTKHLVMHHERMQMTPERWLEDVNEALSMLEEAGVQLHYFDGPIKAPCVIVNGDMWYPDQPAFGKNTNWFIGMGGDAG